MALIFAPATHAQGVCDRTPQVRDRIVGLISGVTDCADVTDEHLSGITRSLYLHSRGIAILKAGDFSGLGNLGELYLDRNQLSTLPSGVFSGLDNLGWLYLDSNQLSTLPSGVFSGLGNLERLFLSGNQLSTLPPGVFSGLGNLERLFLSGNQLSTLPSGVFSGLGNLDTLSLDRNQLSTLPPGVFSDLGNLERLELHDNPLSTLPAGIFVGLTLSELTLPPSVALPLRFIPVGESGEPASARVRVGLAQGAPFDVSVDLFTTNATLSTNTALIPQGATQSEVFTVWRENPSEVVIVGFAGGTSDAPLDSRVEFNISDVFVMEGIGRSVVWISSSLLSGVPVKEGAAAMITVRAIPAPSEALTIGYGIDADGDDATVDADENDYTDVTGGTVTIGAGEESATIEVRITDDETIEAPREFFRVSLTVPLEDAAYSLASPDQTTAIVVIKEGVCDRTPQVRVSLVFQSGVTDCADVTDEHLSGITRSLYLHSRGIAILKAGDFSGLGNLGELYLDRNQLSTLPSGVFSGLDNLGWLYLDSNQLSTLPSGVFSGLGNLERLFLSGNQLSTLPPGVFSGLGNLDTLSLDRNQLSTLPSGVFSGLGNLDTLSLDRNQLGTLPPGVFSDLGNLERLELHDNPLSTLPAGIFVGLTLSELTLPPSVALPLRFIPVSESGEPASARVRVGLAQGAPFDVSVDLFTTNATLSTNTALIPQGATQSEVFTVWRENPSEVVIVGFAGGTSDAPLDSRVEFNISDVFVMEGIGRSVVWISSSLLRGVPVKEGAAAMITVRAIPAPSEALTIGYGIDADGDDATADADENDYTDVTGGRVTIGAGEESATIEVRITDDETIEAPREFFRVSLTVPLEGAAYSLASPDQTTAIVAIKEGVCDRTPQVRVSLVFQSGVTDCADVTDEHLSGITRSLYLHSRGIAILKAGDFSGLGNLGELYLDRNQLSTLPSGVFSGLDNLGWLYLDSNQLSTLPSGVFSGLGNLERLFLSGNQLSTLPPGVFSGLGNLERLFLSGNQLSTLPSGVFSGLGNLDTLSLDRNQLGTLPPGVFSDLGNLRTLDLSGNPGVPFVVARPRLELTGTSPSLGVVEVKLVVDETLPTAMTVDLSAEGGVLSDSQAVIPGGSTESAIFTVTQDADAPAVTLRVSAGTLAGSFYGVVIVPSELELVLDFVVPSVPVVVVDNKSSVVSVEEGATAMITVRATPAPLGPLTIGYVISADGDDATADADGNDYTDVTGGRVTIGAGEESATIKVRIADDEAIEALREFFRVSLTAPPEDAAYVDQTTAIVTIKRPNMLELIIAVSQPTAIVVIKEGVCDRTPQIRDSLVFQSGVSDCADVTDDHLSRITGRLYLLGRGIATLKAGDFSGLGNLEGLRLYRNRLSTLPAGVFSGLGNLEFLELNSNQLSTLPADVFSGLGNLERLYLYSNRLSTLPSGAFSGLGNLEWLYLYSNRLSTLPSGAFSGLGNLERLSLYRNRLRTLPVDVFSGLGNLESLSLGSNQLSTLPVGVFSGLGNLESLSLYDNQLSALPVGVFSGLGNLENLSLYDNQLSTLPVGVFSGLGNLESLSLYDNQLSTLSAGVFSGLGNLETLRLYRNRLITLPSGVFSGLRSLEELDLSSNPGVPFVFARPQLEPTGTSPGRGVVEVKLVVDEPLPTTMTAILSAEGGTLSDSQAVIPGGNTESAVFTVTQEAGSPVVTLRASAGTLAGSFFGVVTALSELVLDFVAPSVSDVAIISRPASGDAYRAMDGEAIRVAVGFDEAVEVLTPTAGPWLTLTIGETPRAASYAPDLSDASTLVFVYVLQIYDADDNGISVEDDALVLAGAEITDLFGNPIESTSLGVHAIADADRHRVAGRAVRVFFEPSAIRLVRGGAAEESASLTVVLKTEPALLGSEEMVIDLAAANGLAVSPRSITLDPTSGTAGITVSASSGATSGEVSATLDLGESSLENARVTTESLMVEVVRGVELSLSDHAGQVVEMVALVAGESTEITVATVPVLEGNERVTVTLNVASGLTLEGVGSALIGGNTLVLTSEGDLTSATVRVGTLTPDLDLKVGVSALGVGENVGVVGEALSLEVVTEIADEVVVVLPSLPIAVQQGDSSTMLRVGTDPLLGMGQAVTVRLTIAPDDAGLSFADGSFITDVGLGETRQSVDVEVVASPEAVIGSSATVTSTAMGDLVGVDVIIDTRSQATLEVVTPQVTLGLRPAGGEIGEVLVLGLGEIKAVELSLTEFMLSGSQTAVFEVSVSGGGLSLQGGTPSLQVGLDAVNVTAGVTVAASANAVSVGELSVRALGGVELSGGTQAVTLSVEVLQEASLVFDPDLVLIRQGRNTGFEMRMSEPLVADRSVAVALVISAEGFSFGGAGSTRHEVVLDADKAMETVTVATTAAIGSTAPVSVSVDLTPGVALVPPPSLSLQALPPPPAVVMIGNESSMVSVRKVRLR